MRKTMAEQWASYREMVLSPDAGPAQVRETQMAFYALLLATVFALVMVGDKQDSRIKALERRVAALELNLSVVDPSNHDARTGQAR
jgi:hypothetical protein